MLHLRYHIKDKILLTSVSRIFARNVIDNLWLLYINLVVRIFCQQIKETENKCLVIRKSKIFITFQTIFIKSRCIDKKGHIVNVHPQHFLAACKCLFDYGLFIEHREVTESRR